MSPLYGPVTQTDHDLAALGFELKSQNLDGSDSTFYLEGQGLFSVNKDKRAGLNMFQRDITIGLRHRFNDSAQRRFSIKVIFDVERKSEYLWRLAYSQKIWNKLRIKMGLMVVEAPQEDFIPVGLEVLNNSDHLQLSLTQEF